MVTKEHLLIQLPGCFVSRFGKTGFVLIALFDAFGASLRGAAFSLGVQNLNRSIMKTGTEMLELHSRSPCLSKDRKSLTERNMMNNAFTLLLRSRPQPFNLDQKHVSAHLPGSDH